MRAPFAVMALTIMCVWGFATTGGADIWGPVNVEWTDNFEDGDYTSNPTWLTFSTPVGATRSVVTWEGDYAFRLTAAYLAMAGAGWSGAYVDQVKQDQGILAWVDTSPLANDNWAAICVLRYSPPTAGFGTGYALAVNHLASGAIAAQLYQINDTSYSAVTGAVLVSPTYTDVWVKFIALGSSGAPASTQLLARVWPDGQAEPTDWTLDSRTTGGGSGITTHYDSGRGGVGVIATGSGVTGDAYFDDIQYVTGTPLCVRPRW